MEYLSVIQVAKNWNLSDRSVRNYCQKGKIPGAFLVGKTWKIPEDSSIPSSKRLENREGQTLLAIIKDEMDGKLSGGIYHKIQIELTYNSNHIEGSKLTHDQTRYIYETNTIGIESEHINVDDIVETVNHFRCIDYIIQNANKSITEKMIKEIHLLLKSGTSDSRKSWFAVGNYKVLPNEVGGRETTAPEKVHEEIKKILEDYKMREVFVLDDLLEFHYRFERIHPFQDGNGRVGRLLLFKECLKYNIVPFIIDDNLKMLYYRGLSEWNDEKGYLRDTCLTAQDSFKKYLDYFRINYGEDE